jgi:hypothetical protein
VKYLIALIYICQISNRVDNISVFLFFWISSIYLFLFFINFKSVFLFSHLFEVLYIVEIFCCCCYMK